MRILKGFEHDLDQDVRYTILTVNEYRYRKNVGDRFLYDILENRHLVVLDMLDRAHAKTPRLAIRRSKVRRHK